MAVMYFESMTEDHCLDGGRAALLYNIVSTDEAANTCGKRGVSILPTEGKARFGPIPRLWLARRPVEEYDPQSHVPGNSEGQVMAKGKKRLEVIHLVCSETGDQNYTLRRKSGGEKLKVKKYSPRLRKHTLHNEKKK